MKTWFSGLLVWTAMLLMLSVSNGNAAPNRAIPTAGPATMTQVATDLNEELVELYKLAPAVLSSVAGTNTITASVIPALVAYADGQSFWLKPAVTNTGAATLNINSLGARAIVNSAGTALSAGDLDTSIIYLIRYYAASTHFRIIAGAQSAGAPTTVSYLVQALNGTLTAERVLAVTAPINATDGGANGNFTLALDSNGITDALLRQSAALSVVGRASNSIGNVADIVAGVDGDVLRRSGTTVGFGQIVSAGINDGTVADVDLRNSAARSVIGRASNTSGVPADIVGGGVGTFLSDNGTTLAFTPFTTVSADFNLTGDITPTQITATQNDYTPTGLATATILKLSTDASRSITGLTGGADGRVLMITNVGSTDIIFENEDAGSTAANRFSFGGDLTLTAGNSLITFYDTGTSRWRLASDTIKAAAGGGEANTGSNVNAGGVGVFDGKVGVDLQFKGINTTTGQGISVTDDAGNNEIDVGLDINAMTEDTDPHQTDDFLPSRDTSAALNRKVRLSKIGTGTRTIYVPAAALVTETTSGCVDGTTETGTNQVMYATKDCDAAAQEGVQFMVGMPKSAAETTITFRADWTAASGTGDVLWLFSCLARSNDDPIDTAFGTEISVTDTLLTAGDLHQAPESAAVTPSGTWTEEDNLWCRVQRDADAGGDTLGVDAKLLGVRVLYTTTVNNDN